MFNYVTVFFISQLSSYIDRYTVQKMLTYYVCCVSLVMCFVIHACLCSILFVKCKTPEEHV